MTVLTTEPLYADGIPLDTYAHWTTIRSGRWQTPGVIGENVHVPARHGAIWVAGKTFDQNTIDLDMLIWGSDDDGNFAADQAEKVRENMAELLRIFTKRYNLIYLEQVQPDGSHREAYAEVLQALDFSTLGSTKVARLVVSLQLPSAFWQDTGIITWESNTGVNDQQVFSMPEFFGATAPLDELVYLVIGPADNPQLRGYDSGSYVGLVGSLASDEHWRINTRTWESVVGTNIGFNGTGTSVIKDTLHGGSARLLELTPPETPSAASLILTGANFGTNSQVKAQGKRKYLIA